MAIKTFDDRNPSTTPDVVRVVNLSTTGSSTSSWYTKTFTVAGEGICFPTAWFRTDSSSDYGTCISRILLNGTEVGREFNRYTTTSGDQAGSCCTVALAVKEGDTIQMSMYSTKAGSKTFHYYALCIGCTLTES